MSLSSPFEVTFQNFLSRLATTRLAAARDSFPH